jgi:hypothetical protein
MEIHWVWSNSKLLCSRLSKLQICQNFFLKIVTFTLDWLPIYFNISASNKSLNSNFCGVGVLFTTITMFLLFGKNVQLKKFHWEKKQTFLILFVCLLDDQTCDFLNCKRKLQKVYFRVASKKWKIKIAFQIQSYFL